MRAQVNPSLVKSDIAVQADPDVAAVAKAAAPVAAISPKPAARTSGAGPSTDDAAQSRPANAIDGGDPSRAAPATDTGKGVVPQAPAVDGNQKPAGTPIEAVKPDAAKPDAAAAAATPHERRPVAAVQLQADTTEAAPLANAVQQPAQPAPASAPAPQLNVTASNSAAVPLNGLALQIALTAQSGRSRFEIRLDPAELGRIDVR
ncbi:MAG TPA: hypothetical protein VFQ87_14790, partial [Bradyrhizobium sp.]|nr:hypothetical protein [Bradyrhizobium sp.]